ncbi:MAG: alpha/beta fold hydrolase [Chloroflexota bacterium]|nr:alpha/beta hydrolase [Dehalococcoidia bacterium]MDW8254246.1 alpha/beta fold hydrolase [Chloroflexota bacterium]
MAALVEKGYIRIRWGQLHYWRAGEEGPALVLLHQTANSSRMWLPLAPLLAPRLRLYALDTPGFGMSDPPPAPPRFEEYCDAFLEALDALHLPRAALLGFHTGAGFAAGIAARAPHRVSRLVLMGAPIFDPEDENTRRARAARRGWEPDLAGEYLRRLWRISTYPDPWVRHRELTDRLLAGPRAWWASAAVSDTDIRRFLPAIRCPTLFLCGANDFMADKQPAAAALLPTATLVLLPGETLIVDQKPAEVATYLLNFLLPAVS